MFTVAGSLAEDDQPGSVLEQTREEEQLPNASDTKLLL
jgi:hypothetical protein